MKKLIFILSFVFGSISLSFAQNGGFAGASTRMGFGPRGMAMGNAMGTVPEEGIFSSYNPALSAFIDGNQFALSHSTMDFDRSLNFLTATFPFPPNAGISVQILNAGVANFDGRSLSGYEDGQFSINEYYAISSFGIKVNQRLAIGIGIVMSLIDYFDDIPSSNGFGLNIGAIYKIKPEWNVGFSVQNLLLSNRFNTDNLYGSQLGSSEVDNYPVRFRLNTSYRFLEGKLITAFEHESQLVRGSYSSTSVSTDFGLISRRTNSENIFGGIQQTRVGVRYALHPRLTARMGYQILDWANSADHQQWSTGFSIHLPFDKFSPSIDYAFMTEPQLIGVIHTFSIQFKL